MMVLSSKQMACIKKRWFKKAEKQTFRTLPKFIKEISDHEAVNWEKTSGEACYEMACHATAAVALGAAWAAAKAFGITNFQASHAMWDFIREWQYSDNKTGLRILDFDNMLYPQYDYIFDKTISTETWRALQEEAKRRIEEHPEACFEVVEHWKRIANGEMPFGYLVSNRR